MDDGNNQEEVYYSITGKAAHGRLKPLLPSHWIDRSPYSQSSPPTNGYNMEKLHFIWENAPRHETKLQRDHVRCYSHLPNGIGILDDKWNLGRLFMKNSQSNAVCAGNGDRSQDNIDKSFARLETHCFRGISGLIKFCQRVGMNMNPATDTSDEEKRQCKVDLDILPDLDEGHKSSDCHHSMPIRIIQPKNLWVIKDANSNGYGGVWIVNEQNVHTFLNRSVTFDPSTDKNGDDQTKVHTTNKMSTTISTPKSTSPLHEEHRYVAQEYAWPPVLFRGRKCHIRVYAVIMNGYAFVHRRCFLHVANDRFQMANDNNGSHGAEGVHGEIFDPAVHITNCCANSHDADKFAGEICADFDLEADASEDEDGKNPIISLKEFFPSVASSVKMLAERSMPYVQGGEQNGGFEYLGLDFILSYKKSTKPNEPDQAVGYLLEVNCPPSQDTATGLNHAEDLHNEVLGDLVKLWVIPHVNGTHRKGQVPKDTLGGWKCVHTETSSTEDDVGKMKEMGNLMVPSKAVILNKIKWGMYEKKAKRAYEADSNQMKTQKLSSKPDCDLSSISIDDVTSFARKKFPYFEKNEGQGETESALCSSMDNCITTNQRNSRKLPIPIFFENAGGAQVPLQVIRHMVDSLSYRHRSLIGTKSKEDARSVLMTILGGNADTHRIYLGANATSLFNTLAQIYLTNRFVSQADDIVIASENHIANVTPWKMVASLTGARICWWNRRHIREEQRASLANEDASLIVDDSSILSTELDDLLTERTRIVCLSHASNILGSVRDIRSLCQKIRQKCPRAQIIIDGVAAVPHVYANVSNLGVDWYIVSCHKLFGPHIGAMCVLKSAVNDIISSSRTVDLFGSNIDYKLLEVGTLNYEGCSGICGLGEYFSALGGNLSPLDHPKTIIRHNSTNYQMNKLKTGEDPAQKRSLSCMEPHPKLSLELVVEAYRRIAIVENQCLNFILQQLRSCPHVRLIREGPFTNTLPIVSFIHDHISATEIVKWCFQNNVVIRCGNFLTTELMQTEFDIHEHCCRGDKEGIVRISSSHYNDINDAQILIRVLRTMEGWM